MAEALGDVLTLVRFDAEGRVVEANERFLALSGQDKTALQRLDFDQLFDMTGFRGSNGRLYFEAVLRGECRSAYARMANGRLLHVACAPLDGGVGRVIASVSDITRIAARNFDNECKIEALDRSQAVIEFDLQGIILHANHRFCTLFGYEPGELEGRHHGILVDAAYRASAHYSAFWDTLRRGAYMCSEFRRIAKDGRTVWIQASYNPVLDRAGRPVRIVKFATETTDAKVAALENGAKIAAIDRSQAVIEFSTDGTILAANDNFLRMTGYALSDIVGRHHSIFVPKDERDGSAYRGFWDSLRSGDFQTAEYRRIGKDGREVWIQATYNPVFDLDGRLAKVVKFASDVTAAVNSASRCSFCRWWRTRPGTRSS